MSITSDSADIFDDYVTHLTPASGAKKPQKSLIRALFASIDTAIATVRAESSGIQTGDFVIKARTSTPTGFIKPSGTIGNVASGATTRANADTSDLFTLWWTDFDNTVLHIQDSTGADTTRGASAAADFAALKRLPVPDARDRYIGIWGDDLAGAFRTTVGAALTDTVQYHEHDIPSDEADGAGSSRVADSDGTGTDKTPTTGGPIDMAGHDAVRVSEETRPKTLILRGFYKL